MTHCKSSLRDEFVLSEPTSILTEPTKMLNPFSLRNGMQRQSPAMKIACVISGI